MPPGTKCEPHIEPEHTWGAHLNWGSIIIAARPKRKTLSLEVLLQVIVVVVLCLHLGDIRSSFDYTSSSSSSSGSSSSEHRSRFVCATSINYGISQQPITDISQLMPKLCQNQTVICEGSYCIPNVRKCVCDLRMPVQFGRFCLRQVDMETKCFVTNQCNHTIKDAVCIDINSNSVLDYDSSKFKLDQWQHLNELRQQSQTATGNGGTNSKDGFSRPQFQTIITTTESVPRAMFLFDSGDDKNSISDTGFNLETRNDVIISNARNSPYEINYDTPELLVQNHTGRKQNSSNPLLNNLRWAMVSKNTQEDEQHTLTNQGNSISTSASITISTETTPTTTSSDAPVSRHGSEQSGVRQTTDSIGVLPTEETAQQAIPTTMLSSKLTTTSAPTTTTTSSHGTDLASRKKLVVKSASWPPGICSCPYGFMFDSMLRKCLALSLADSHCQVDLDCKQIATTHCSHESKKCECDEPLEWNQKELACVRPKLVLANLPDDRDPNVRKETGSVSGFIDNLLPPLILAKLLPDYTMLLLIFVFLVIIGTLIILRLTVKCFSSSNSALISPKTKKKPSKQPSGSNLLPRSPYATMRRPEHKPSSQLSNFTQATRGRILNYDFEQDGPNYEIGAPSQSSHSTSTLQRAIGNNKKDNQASINGTEKTANTLMRHNKGHKHQNFQQSATLPKKSSTANDEKVSNDDDQIIELNDNISVSQMESGESKSDNSILAIPGPPTTQQPPYMLASAMKGQGSAIAAAAAAVANKRMQMAQKKNLEQQSSGKLANGSPVFL